MKSGVYRIVNLVNGKCYIGSSVNIRTRWNRHRYHLRKGRHPNPHLQNSWNKYGENNFKFEIIHLCTRDKTIENEQFFLDKLNPEYNIAIDALAPALGMTGENCPSYGKRPHNYGKHLSEETKFWMLYWKESHRGGLYKFQDAHRLLGDTEPPKEK